jgi:AcrR family transcriptional regulator
VAEPLAPLTPRAREIVAAARELLEQEGAEALTMRRLADRLGIRAPSLYKHLPGKAALEAAVIATGLEDLAAVLEAAVDRTAGAAAGGTTSAAPLAALTAAYRAFALDHPHLYRLMTDQPLPREQLPPGVEDRAAAPVIRAAAGDPARARAIWAFAHGMVLLELTRRFPPGADLEPAWQEGITAFQTSAVRPARTRR